MILSDRTIKKQLKENRLKIVPAPEIKSSSVRMHLADQFAKVGGKVRKLKSYNLKPLEFILGSTKEKVTLPDDLAGLYDGSTTLARCGITSHMGSMLISPGSSGNITLEIFNASDTPFEIKAGMRIGQLIILKLDSFVEKPQREVSTYTGKKLKGLVQADKEVIYR